MKKILTFILFPFLLLSFNFQNLLNLPKNNNQNIKLKEEDIILDLSLGSSVSGILVDTNLDKYADTLYTWGSGNLGQLGNGGTSNKNIPTEVNFDWDGNLINFEFGFYHSGVTVDTDLDGYADTLYMWGYNGNGQIGDGTTSNKLTPTIITPDGQSDWGGDIIDLSLGSGNSAVTIDTDLDGYADTLYIWGSNSSGQIGDNTTTSIYFPTKITPQGQSNWGGNIIDLSLTSNDSSLTIDTDLDGYADTLYMWGNNNNGQIGDNTTTERHVPTKITPQGQSDWGGNIIDLSLGNTFSSVTIDTDLDGYADTLYIWGSNSRGEIGDNTTIDRLVPKKITPQGQSDWGGNIIDLSLGSSNSSVTIDTNLDGYADTLYIWGSNSRGQIGDNTTTNRYIPTKVTPQGENDWGGNIIDFNLGGSHSGLIIDINLDGYADTLYMWGNNEYGQLGDGSNVDKHIPTLIASSYSFFVNEVNFYYQNDNNVEININLNDYQNIVNEAPEVILIDQNNINYTTTFIDNKSDIENDQYYYQINNILYGENYHFKNILINDDQFSLNQDITTDYLISDYNFISSTEETETIALNLDQNSDDFNISNYTEDQRKIEVNYTNIDKDVSDSQQFILDENDEITLTDLNAETNYRIDSIDYFYEDNSYKYTIDQEIKIFQTNAAIPEIKEETISVVTNSIQTNQFQYTIEIDNLKVNSNSDNFTQYDVNDGIWLIDQDNNYYQSTFVDAKLIANGKVNGTQNYQLTFLQSDLLTGQSYQFIGISITDPNISSSDIINFSTPFIVETTAVNKIFINDSFSIDQNSITTNSFIYTIEIDNLILIDDNQIKPIFTNFDLDDGLYLIDSNGTPHKSNYIENSAINLGLNEETGATKYQFNFKVNGLEEDTTYNFTNLSFTDKVDDDSLDISENGVVKTDNNASEKIIIWVIIIVLIIFILLILILIWIDLKMKKRTKEISDKLNNSDF